MTEVRWELVNPLSEKVVIESEHVEPWVADNLKRLHLEEKIDKLIDLMAVVIDAHLWSHPDEVGIIADILDCKGHKFTVHEHW